ncbi:MAG: hypothetical protein AB7G15_06890 [Alphaproteobacteria bacterium]
MRLIVLPLIATLAVAACAEQAKLDAPGSVGINAPSDLHGKTEAEVVARIGQPKVRNEANAVKVWRYNGHHCSLDVFIAGGKVTQTDLRRHQGVHQSDSTCLLDALTKK